MEYLVKQEEGDDREDLCIVCCAPVKVNSFQKTEEDSLLSSNLNVIFLLRNLLQVPDNHLEDNLRNCGDPVNWIRLCDQCGQLTRQAEELHWNVVKTQEQLRSVQQLILDKSKAPLSSSPSIDKKIGNWERKEIWRKTRAFISNCNQSQSNKVNPFIEGDKLANYLQSQQNSTSLLILPKVSQQDEHVIKVEVDHFDGEEDTEWEPPPEVDDLATSKLRSSPKSSKHRRVKGKPNRLGCHLCPRKFRKQCQLNVHLYLRHKDDPKTIKLIEDGYQLFPCQEFRCNAYFSKQLSLNAHMKKEHSSNDPSPRRFPCQLCSKDFCTKGALTLHHLHHHQLTDDQDLIKCDLCNHQSRSSYSLTVHKRKVHKIWKRGPIKTFVKRSEQRICHLCGKTLAESSALKQHLVALHKEDPLAKQLIDEGYGIWKCKVPGCSNKYTYKPGLDEHLKTMHGDKVEMSHFCQFCGKGFYAEESLQRHEKRVHELTERRFKCELCGFAMTTQAYLDGHIKRVHTPNEKYGGEVKGDKVEICSVCGIQFWDKGKLEKHIIIHDKDAEQPHPCDVCGRGYSTHESMWKHKRKIHKIYRRPDDSRIKKIICG